MKKRLFALVLALTVVLSSVASAELWYVQTGNGKPLNVRSQPTTKSKALTRLSSGSAIEVTKLLEDDDWAEITVGNRTGYCMTSFLMKGARAVSDKLGYTMIYDDALFDYESKDGVDTYWWKDQQEGKPNCYLAVSSLPDTTAQAAIDGLALQSGVEGDRFTVTLGGEEVLSYTFVESEEASAPMAQYVCVPRSNGSVLLIELGLYADADAMIGEKLQDMLYSMTFATSKTDLRQKTKQEYVQCKDCGGWFKAGKAFKNHTCPAKSNKKLVQCPDCGGWFEKGNIFRNHVCPAKDEKTYE